MAQHQLGANTVVEEDQNGETVLKNTNTGNSVTLSSIVELTQALGSDTTPVPGTSHFEALNTDSIDITPVASGTITVAANERTTLSQDSSYNSDFYNVVLNGSGDSSKNGSVQINFTTSGSTGDGVWQLEEQIGNDWEGDWAIIRYSTQ